MLFAKGNTWQMTPLSDTLQPGEHLLIGLARGNTGSGDLPTPDVTGHLSLASRSGKVALVSTTTALTCGTPCLPDPRIEDLVGYGSANSFEGTGAIIPLSTTTAALRKDNGCVDTDSNTADFTVGTPAPRNRASPAQPCTPGSATRIHDIQSAGHLSLHKDQTVSAVEGIVTATLPKGFYMQDPLPDANPATSEAIFVFTSSVPAVGVGGRVAVSGTVREFRPGVRGE